MNAQPHPTLRMNVPPVGGAVLATVAFGFVAFFVGVAVFNLMHWPALSPIEIGGSILWLAIVGMWLATGIATAPGLHQLLVNALGILSRRAFVEVGRGDDDRASLRYGFAWFGREFDYARIELTRLEMIGWGAGQASDMSGRDRNDWTVAVWYRTDGHSGRLDRTSLKGRDLVLVTPYLPKQEAVAIGDRLVALLREAGVELVPGDDETEFMVARV